MRHRFGNKVEWVGPRDVRHKGKFAFVRSPNNFYHCREGFMDNWFAHLSRRRILMSTGISNGPKTLIQRREALASFIWRAEDRLGIQDKRKTIFNEMK